MSLSRQQRRAAERAAQKNQNRAVAAGNTPISQARLEANRANAQLSSGPRTAEGKAASRENSFKHGLYSRQLIVGNEDPAQLDALKASLFAEHQPATETEALLVQEMAEHYWRMKRYRCLETAFLNMERPQPREAETAQRMHGRCERSFYKSLNTLRELQKARKVCERTVARSTAAGFVPSKAVALAANGGFVPTNSQESEPADSSARQNGAPMVHEPASPSHSNAA